MSGGRINLHLVDKKNYYFYLIWICFVTIDNIDRIQYPGEEGDMFELRVYGQDIDPDSGIFILNKN